jgi:hypothetical protein
MPPCAPPKLKDRPAVIRYIPGLAPLSGAPSRDGARIFLPLTSQNGPQWARAVASQSLGRLARGRCPAPSALSGSVARCPPVGPCGGTTLSSCGWLHCGRSRTGWRARCPLLRRSFPSLSDRHGQNAPPPGGAERPVPGLPDQWFFRPAWVDNSHRPSRDERPGWVDSRRSRLAEPTVHMPGPYERYRAKKAGDPLGALTSCPSAGWT